MQVCKHKQNITIADVCSLPARPQHSHTYEKRLFSHIAILNGVNTHMISSLRHSHHKLHRKQQKNVLDAIVIYSRTQRASIRMSTMMIWEMRLVKTRSIVLQMKQTLQFQVHANMAQCSGKMLCV